MFKENEDDRKHLMEKLKKYIIDNKQPNNLID